MNVIFCGGGTGGHLVPGLAVRSALVREHGHVDATFLGTSRPGEVATLRGEGVRHMPLFGMTRRRRDYAAALWTARRELRRLRPDHVIGLGGYASVPGVLAAQWLGIPITLLEQNAVCGRATDALARFAGGVLGGLPVAEPPPRFDVVGTPVRPAFQRLALRPAARCRWPGGLLVLGGSQGSRAVNDAALRAAGELRGLLRGLPISHQAGGEETDRVRAAYRRVGLDADVRPFFEDMARRLEGGPVVVSRAGGTTLAELACAGVPTVLIPHARSVRDHQRVNAAAAPGVAVVAEGGDLTGPLRSLLSLPLDRVRAAAALRTIARPEAARAVAVRLFGEGPAARATAAA